MTIRKIPTERISNQHQRTKKKSTKQKKGKGTKNKQKKNKSFKTRFVTMDGKKELILADKPVRNIYLDRFKFGERFLNAYVEGENYSNYKTIENSNYNNKHKRISSAFIYDLTEKREKKQCKK